MKRKISSNRGLSLVELLIVAAIMALALIPILTLVSTRTNQAIGTGNHACAHNHLLNVLRQQESRLYAQLFDREVKRDETRTVEVNWGLTNLNLEEEISVVHCSELTDLWKIRATIRWKEKRGTKSVEQIQSLIRLIANPLPRKCER